MKSLVVGYWYVKIQCEYMEHILEHITFYVKKSIAPFVVCSDSPLVHNKPLGAPTFVSLAYLFYKNIHRYMLMDLYWLGDNCGDAWFIKPHDIWLYEVGINLCKGVGICNKTLSRQIIYLSLTLLMKFLPSLNPLATAVFYVQLVVTLNVV